MSGSKVDIERLRKAFLERSEASPSPRDTPAQAGAIWDAVSGDLDKEQLLELLDRAGNEPDTALEWRIARELLHEMEGGTQEEPLPVQRRLSRRAFALAASVAIAALAGLFWLLPESDPPAPYRQPADLQIESMMPVGEGLSAHRPTLRWSVVEGARYDVSILRPDTLKVVFDERNLETARVELPLSLFEELPQGTELLWRVEAVLPSGERVRSETFRARLENGE